MLGLRDNVLEDFNGCLRQAVKFADCYQPNASFLELAQLLFQKVAEQSHQGIDFVTGTSPIFRTEGIQSQVTDAQIETVIDDPLDALNTFTVSQDAWQASFFSPTAITVHNNRKMSGNLHKQKCPGLIKQEPVKYHREDESGNRMLT